MEDTMVVVAAVQGEIEEEQLRSFLAANGIPTATRGEALRHTHGLVLNGLGQVHILVASTDAERARDLLDRAERGELAVGDEPLP